MKKILIGLIVLLVLIIPNVKVYALEDSFYEGEYISGEYIKKFRNGSGKYEQLRFFRRKSDNQIVYCIELWEALSSNKIITGYDYDQYNYANIDYSVWERIMLISYYGYGYENHTDSKWYAITQFMIWKETSPDTNIYFTDTLNGNKIEKYQQEMNEINLLIQNHGNIPSFYNQTYQVTNKSTTTIKDTNNVLDNFEVMSSGGTEISRNENSLIVTKSIPGKSQIILVNSGKRFQTSPIVYIDNDGQNVLAPGNYYPIYASFNVVIPSANIIVNKFDQNTQSNIPQGDGKLEGTKIQLLDKDNELVAEKIISKDGTLTFENIGYGTYYLKEVEAGTGYLLNSETVTLKVDSNIEIINFYNEIIKNKIIFKKYLKNPITGNIKNEVGAIFSIYNSKNEKVTTVTTDSNGIAQITLPYGNYKVKQEAGTKNHYYVNDFEIKIIENDIVQTFDLYNEELTTKIKVINIDDDSKLPILEQGAQFKIIDLETNQYVQDEEGTDIILETDDLGRTDFIILSSGKYKIEQVKVISGYSIDNPFLSFDISEEIGFELDDNNNKYLEIEISNMKQKGQIEIDKYTEYYLNDDLVKTEKNTNISIPIYAKEDIYSKDGIKLYQKDEEVENATFQEGKVITPFLVFGNYYLKNDLDNTIIDIVLNKSESEKVKLLDKVYEYEEINNDSTQELQETIITVPNTATRKNIFSDINVLLIVLGLLIIKKVKKYENN